MNYFSLSNKNDNQTQQHNVYSDTFYILHSIKIDGNIKTFIRLPVYCMRIGVRSQFYNSIYNHFRNNELVLLSQNINGHTFCIGLALAHCQYIIIYIYIFLYTKPCVYAVCACAYMCTFVRYDSYEATALCLCA